MATKKKAPAKKAVQEETRVEGTQPVEQQPVEQPQEEKQEEHAQNESTQVESEKRSERKHERVITILSSADSAFLSGFAISRSAVSRAVLRGTREFLEQFATKKDVTEQEIIDALQSKLK